MQNIATHQLCVKLYRNMHGCMKGDLVGGLNNGLPHTTSYLQSIMEKYRDGRVEEFWAPAVMVSFETDQILIPSIDRMDLL